MSKVIGILSAILVVLLVSGDSSPKAFASSKVEADRQSQKGEAERERKGAPEISPVEDLFDFGRVRQGDKVEHVFRVRNTGTADLVVKKATGD
jgi:hypothetical protein